MSASRYPNTDMKHLKRLKTDHPNGEKNHPPNPVVKSDPNWVFRSAPVCGQNLRLFHGVWYYWFYMWSPTWCAHRGSLLQITGNYYVVSGRWTDKWTWQRVHSAKKCEKWTRNMSCVVFLNFCLNKLLIFIMKNIFFDTEFIYFE